MRILLVNDYGTATGGAETGLITLREVLRQRGHQARLFASTAQAGAHQFMGDEACFGTTSRWRTLLQTANPWAYVRLRQVLRDFRPHVVHVRLFLTQLSPLILPALRGVPSLYEAVWYRPLCLTGTKVLPGGAACQDPWGRACHAHQCVPLRDWLPLMLQMKLWYRWRGRFAAVVTTSEAVRRQMVRGGFEQVHIIHGGAAIRPPRPPLVPPPTVAFAAHLMRHKGADVLLRAFARVGVRVPEARLVVAGAGPERQSLEQLAAELGISARVAFVGHLSPERLEQLYEEAWVLAVPSVWAEPFGLVAVEAMMRGTAVVASNTGGLSEIVSSGQSGWLVPPGDVEALAGALTPLLQSSELAERVGRAGREVALARFTSDRFADQFLDVYQALAGPGVV